MNIKNKIAIVTGGTHGIGFETALKLREKGAAVIVTGRNKEYFKNCSDNGLFPFRCDVADEKEVKDFFAEFEKQFGKLDILINNAGYGYFDKLENIDSTKFIDVYKTNVLGSMLMAKESLRFFRKGKSGNIINISSTAGLKGFASGSPYVATKFALKGMTECWRDELRKENIRVILINPSEVQTDFHLAAGFENREFNPTKLVSEDIAHAIISALEMNDRGFITELTVFATNPKD